MDTKPTGDLKFDLFVTKKQKKKTRIQYTSCIEHFRCFYGVFTFISHSKEWPAHYWQSYMGLEQNECKNLKCKNLKPCILNGLCFMKKKHEDLTVPKED